MREILHPVHWFPFAWILVQSYLLLSMAMFVLRRWKILILPLAGMEYGDVAMAGTCLLGTLVVSSGEAGAIFQAAKTLQNSGTDVFPQIFLKFTEYFLFGVLTTGIYLVVCMCNRRFIFSGHAAEHSGSTTIGILAACLNIGFAVVFWFWIKELAERITPAFVNFT